MANRAKWELLGIRLGIDNGTIEAIKSKNHGISTLCLKEVLSTWLNENYDTQQHGYPSWRRLCKVIASPAGAENQSLADDIAEQHKTPLKEGYYNKINCHTFNLTLISTIYRFIYNINRMSFYTVLLW